MFIRNSLRSGLLLLVLFLAIVSYFISSNIYHLSADEALLRSFSVPSDVQSSEQEQGNTSSLPAPELIPRIIHQTYKTKTIPDAWREAYNTCLTYNPDGNWTRILWTDDTAREFIRDSYPSFLATYDGYPYNIQRVDAFRYFVLYHYGGIYLDLDVGCAKDLSPLLRHHAFFAKTEPIGVSNDVMGVEKGHPVFGTLVVSLRENSYRRGTKYPTVMMSTGPMFLTKLLLSFLKTRSREKTRGGYETQNHEPIISVLPPEMYASSPVSYFAHYDGSTWHSWDAEMIVAISQNPIPSALGVFLLCFAWIRCRRRVRNRSYASTAAKT